MTIKTKEPVYTLVGKFDSKEEWEGSYRKTLKVLNYSFIALTIGFIIGTIIFEVLI